MPSHELSLQPGVKGRPNVLMELEQMCKKINNNVFSFLKLETKIWTAWRERSVKTHGGMGCKVKQKKKDRRGEKSMGDKLTYDKESTRKFEESIYNLRCVMENRIKFASLTSKFTIFS